MDTSDIDESFVPSPPSDSDAESSPPPLPVPTRGRADTLDTPRTLHAARFSAREGRWIPTTNCSRGVREPLPTWIRLVSWNVDFQTKNAKKRLMAALLCLQREVFRCQTPNQRPNPCCILLQEVSVGAFTMILTNEWVQRYFVVVPTSTDQWPANATYGTVTLVSRTVPVSNAFTIEFGNSSMMRNAIFVDVKLGVPALPHAPRLSDGIVTVRIANTHLESLPRGAAARPMQLRLISEALQEYDLHAGVVAGDMNAIGPSDITIAEDVGLMDAWQHGDDDEEGFTWGYQPRERYPPARLDKVLFTTRGGFEVEEPERFGVGARAESGDWISDHYGLMTTLHIVREDEGMEM
ncbi:Endonuclease/exonuclease/phosphatase [Pisolithus sp. B1]|nr:Endonuclease/exonuclease/phosphatase [Pisolithus sp. B1]